MKISPIELDAILGRAATKSDGSLALTFSTGEFSESEMATLFKLLRRNLKMRLTPTGEALEPPVEVKSEVASKTPSQRLRAVYFCLWKYRQLQNQTKLDYDAFYSAEMNRLIESIKSELPEPGSF